MYHPWRAFRAHADWTLAWDDHLDDMAVLCWQRRVVTMRRGLTQVERRCTIAHELEHIRRGPSPDDPVLIARDELTASKLAARRLIGVHDLGEALAWSEHPAVVADLLWVDVPTLEVRLEHLHPAERHYLRRRLDDVHTP